MKLADRKLLQKNEMCGVKVRLIDRILHHYTYINNELHTMYIN